MIVAGDEDNNGVAIPADALSTPSGSSIVTVAGSRTVQFGHDGGRSGSGAHGRRGTPEGDAPGIAEGLTIAVTWSEALDPASTRSDAGGFRVRIAGANSPAVTAVAVDGADPTKLRLTIAERIADGTQNVTLEYTRPGTGAKIRDAAGNDALDFTAADALDVSVTPDTTAPMVDRVRIDGATLTVTFDEPLMRAPYRRRRAGS